MSLPQFIEILQAKLLQVHAASLWILVHAIPRKGLVLAEFTFEAQCKHSICKVYAHVNQGHTVSEVRQDERLTWCGKHACACREERSRRDKPITSTGPSCCLGKG